VRDEAHQLGGERRVVELVDVVAHGGGGLLVERLARAFW
jgi:hypothetical protein